MMAWLEQFLVRFPELALYLTIGIGYYIGQFKFGEFSLGPVTGSLFAGILIGQFADVPISSALKSFLFLLFLFGIGYSVGPQFLQALKRDGIKSIVLAVTCSVTGLIAAYLVSRILQLDAGYAAGLLSGALTQSPAMGTATEAIGALPLPEDVRSRLVAHVAVADAVCYLFGSIGAIWFCSVLGPKLLKVDIEAEARELERNLGIKRSAPGSVSGYRNFEFRAFRVAKGGQADGKTVGQIDDLVPNHRVFVARVRRNNEVIEASPNFTLQAGDIVAVSGRRSVIVEVIGTQAEEVEDRELLDIPFLVNELLVTKPTSGSLDAVSRESWARGVYLRSVRRGSVDLPVSAALTLEKGDVLTIVGTDTDVARVASKLGTVIAPTTSTDFVVLGLAIFLGGLVGSTIRIPIGGIELALGMSVGALVSGLIVGHLRTQHPLFGRIPDGAIALMTSLGLAAFVAMTGLHAGPVFVSALREAGLGLLIGGIVVTMTPLFVSFAVGHFLLRMNPVLLLGGLAGAITMTAAMAAVQTRSRSHVAVLGYTPAYPVSQILLTLWGTVIVVVTAGP